MLENLKKYKVILASGSPRRKELMAGLNFDFTVKVLPGVDESYPSSLKGEEIPLYICKEKAAAYLSSMAENELIITADTIVWLENEVLGKPQNESEAKEMLRRLSGKSHQVITGVCISTKQFQHSFATLTEVTFSSLTEEEIDYYVTNYSPMDKAGAYGIQEWIGFVGVKSISGSYFNVMGLPIQRLYKELAKL